MFQPKDPGFAARLTAAIPRQPTMKTLGFTVVSIAAGEVVLAMPLNLAFTQEYGFLHGGIVTVGLDGAAGYATFSLLPADAAIVTIELKTSFLAPAKGERFIFEGHVIKSGRSLTFCEAKGFAEERGQRKLIATMTATMITVTGRKGTAV